MRKILIIILLAVSLIAEADKWYIATAANGGSDTNGDGSISAPWLTLKHAADTVTGANFVGDTIMVGAGTFTEPAQVALGVGVSIYGTGATSIITSGAALNPIIYLYSDTEGTDGSQSISYLSFDGNSLTALRAILSTARSNVKVHNCTFEDFSDCAVRFEGAVTAGNKPTTYATGIEFTDNTVDNCANYTTYGTGALWYNGTSGMVISGNTMTQTSRAAGDNGYLIKGRYNKGDLIHDNYLERIVDNQPYHFTIEFWDGEGGTQVYENTLVGGAIDVAGYYFIKGTHSFSCDVYRNVMRLNNTNTLNTTDYPTWAIIVEGGAEDVIVRQNLMQNFNYPIGISVLQPETIMDRVTFYANVVWNWGNSATAHGAAVLVGGDPDNGTMRNVSFYNNTFYDDGVGFDPPYVIWFNATGGTFHDWRFINNICIGGGSFFFRTQSNSGTPVMDTLIIRNNVQYGNGYSNEPYYDASFTPSNVTYSGAVKLDPLFISTTDFHLQSTSPAINAGIDVSAITGGKDFHGASLYGAAYDIGAFEYGVNRMLLIGTTIPTINYKIPLIDH
jgi:hypothetical protein